MVTNENKDFYYPPLKYNEKFYKKWIVRKFVGAVGKVLNLYDWCIDKKICGRSLVKYVPSLYRETKGATGSQATRYMILEDILGKETFSENDKFIDVGCGKARVLAYMLKKKFPGKLYGIELNHDVAEYAKGWTKKYDNVEVFEGDAFAHNFDDYNIFFLGRPFETEFFAKFIEKFEGDITHPITFYYWVDQQSGHLLNNRPGWTLHKRKWLFRKYGLFLAFCPQRYSVWTYEPVKN